MAIAKRVEWEVKNLSLNLLGFSLKKLSMKAAKKDLINSYKGGHDNLTFEL